jgi:hypothetical protein
LTVWTFLDEARDPGQIKPGAIVVAGDQDAAAVCEVIDLAPAGDGTWSLGGPTLSGVGDEEFADYIASRLAGLRGVAAVSLGGSRASGTSRPDSDWDFAVYYRGRFDPDDLSGLIGAHYGGSTTSAAASMIFQRGLSVRS